MFITRLLSDNPQEQQFAVMWLFAVIVSICCHEYAHARVALSQGDSTAADQGHLTLNPLKQMGKFSLIMLAVMGLAWGKVPVNPARFNKKYSGALISFAGPLMNLAIFIACCLSLALFEDGTDAPFIILLKIGAILNMLLFLLNMMPVPMLDGWGVYSYFFPKLKIGNSEFVNGITLFLFFAIFFSIEYLYFAAGVLTQLMTDFFGLLF